MSLLLLPYYHMHHTYYIMVVGYICNTYYVSGDTLYIPIPILPLVSRSTTNHPLNLNLLLNLVFIKLEMKIFGIFNKNVNCSLQALAWCVILFNLYYIESKEQKSNVFSSFP